jgi:hypothetical protein
LRPAPCALRCPGSGRRPPDSTPRRICACRRASSGVNPSPRNRSSSSPRCAAISRVRSSSRQVLPKRPRILARMCLDDFKPRTPQPETAGSGSAPALYLAYNWNLLKTGCAQFTCLSSEELVARLRPSIPGQSRSNPLSLKRRKFLSK